MVCARVCTWSCACMHVCVCISVLLRADCKLAISHSWHSNSFSKIHAVVMQIFFLTRRQCGGIRCHSVLVRKNSLELPPKSLLAEYYRENCMLQVFFSFFLAVHKFCWWTLSGVKLCCTHITWLLILQSVNNQWSIVNQVNFNSVTSRFETISDHDIPEFPKRNPKTNIHLLVLWN